MIRTLKIISLLWTATNGFILTQRPSAVSRCLALKAEQASVCVVGGGVAGLAAALTAAKNTEDNVVLLEASETLGGRVQSDVTDDGFVLDRGFAVFIEEYPFAKELLDYDALKLGKFLPGALVKIKDSDKLGRVADPLRQPQDIFTALLAPVGSLFDKIAVLPLVFHVRTKTIEELFAEPETDTLTALKERWGFSDDMIEKFFKPFLEGIYLAPLEEQSSRMFTFVFKMFSEGAATLPAGGIGAVSKQLAEKASATGATLKTSKTVSSITKNSDGYLIKCSGGDIQAESVILATEGPAAKRFLSNIDGLEYLANEPDQKQRSVGCLYYSFNTDVPVKDPILILNGGDRDYDSNPVNNVCFPSIVNPSYAPSGSNICSVTILKNAMETFEGRDDELDDTVRKQLSKWFPDEKDNILKNWKLERIYKIPNAQPAQFGGPLPANSNRACNTYRDRKLPDGLFVCGDHVSTATLNGALESGVNAGKAASMAATASPVRMG